MTDPFPAWLGKNSRHSRSISRGGTLHRKDEKNYRVVPPFQEWCRCVSPFQRNMHFLHCLDCHTRIDSNHGGTWHSLVGKPRGTASWENLQGKPQIP